MALCPYLLLFLLTLFTISASTAPLFDEPKPMLRHLSLVSNEQASSMNRGRKLVGKQTFFYNQTIDHFNYRPKSYDIFSQRYVMIDDYWGGPKTNSPIFVYLGAEQSIDNDLLRVGFLVEKAPRFKALVVYIEHRYYGVSNPAGSMAASLEDPELRGYFSSAQALADYAEVIAFLKESLQAQHCPIIVIGGSYGGMLASWFRLKYPHLAHGALASSAPILMNVVSPDTYTDWVTKDYQDTSENCYRTIKQSCEEMDNLADSQPNGLSILAQKFHTCSNLSSTNGLKRYVMNIVAGSAQYNAPPVFPLGKICEAIDNEAQGADILDKVAAGIAALRNTSLVSMDANRTCFAVSPAPLTGPATVSETTLGWSWQKCSEMVNPIGVSSNNSIFPVFPFVLDDFIMQCNLTYGVPTRPSWVNTYYGAQDIKLFLKMFGSNIIFSNGLFDPYSQMSVLENITDTLVAVTAPKGSHCLDLLASRASDPDWLTALRNKEVEIIKGWLSTYYADLNAFLNVRWWWRCQSKPSLGGEWMLSNVMVTFGPSHN